MKSLILDLRGNPGGYLTAAAEMTDELLEGKKMIVYTQGVNSPRQDYFASRKGMMEEGRLVVLIDESSASASEILSGAIQDWDRGVVIGRRSFGKGLVQRPLNFPDGSLIRLTIAKYYTPSGRCIQKPYSDGLGEYNDDITKRYKHGELWSKDSIHFNDSLKFNTLIEKRTVYGGGGIMPDIFIPMDTTRYSDFYREIVGLGIFNRFIFNQLDFHRAEWTKEYKTLDSFKKSFLVDDKLMSELYQYSEKEGVKARADEKTATADVQNQIKALIARGLFGNDAYFMVLNDKNDIVQKAVEVIQSKEYSQYLKATTSEKPIVK